MRGARARTAIRAALLCGALAVGCAPPVAELPPPQASAATESVTPPSLEERLRRSLETRGDFDFDDTPLERVLVSLQGRFGVPCLVDTQAIAEVAEHPITFHAHGISLASAVELILTQAGLGFCPRGDVVWISTADEIEALHETRVCDVTDLVQALGDGDDLVMLITSTVRPAAWDEVGGPGHAAVNRLNDRFALTVSQPWAVQEEVAALLAALRKVPFAQEGPPPLVQIEAEDRAPIDDDESAQGLQRFACELYRHAGQLETGSVCISPLNVAAALHLIHAAARGRTAKEIAQTLHANGDSEEIHTSFAALCAELSQDDDAHKLSLAHRWWVDQLIALRPAFVESMAARYAAGQTAVDMTDPVAACRQINSWIGEHTGGRIPEAVLPVDLVGPLLVTSALYFHQPWQEQFPASERTLRFEAAGGAVDVASMKHLGDYRYAETAEVALVEKDYAGGRLTMTLVLPHRGGVSLSEFEQTFSPSQLRRLTSAAKVELVELELPKFQLLSELNLADVLKQLGIVVAFDPARADFSEATDSRDLYLAVFKHAVSIDVNERGTEAAAVSIGGFGGVPEHKTFRADRPFLFVIRDRPTGAILFMGRYAGDAGATPGGPHP